MRVAGGGPARLRLEGVGERHRDPHPAGISGQSWRSTSANRDFMGYRMLLGVAL
ncbi:MAG: hypothetical protein U5K56_19230 [Halioglobus sp.]|nr:hypothetical protein [Halioglobus sp.]